MKRTLLLSSVLFTAMGLMAATPKVDKAVSSEKQELLKEKVEASVVSRDRNLQPTGVPMYKAASNAVVANYNVPAGIFFKGIGEDLRGYSNNLAYGGAYVPVTWTNASTGAETYSWTYTNPEFPEDEDLQNSFSSEADLTVTYPYSYIASPALEVVGANGETAFINPIEDENLQTKNTLPMIYYFGGSGNDAGTDGISTYPRYGYEYTSWSSLIETGYMKDPNSEYAEYFDQTTGTATDWAELFEDMGTNPKMVGFANLFPKPQSAYLTTRAWTWVALEVSAATELTLTLYKVNDEGQITDDVVAMGKTTVLPNEEYKTVGFDLYVVDEDGFETDDPVLIESAVMMVLSGFNVDNSGITEITPVSGTGMWWDYGPQDNRVPNPYEDITHSYSVLTYTDNNNVEQTAYVKCPFKYRKSKKVDNIEQIPGVTPVFTSTDYMFCMDFLFGACEEANNDYTFAVPAEGGSKTFDFNVIYYITPDDIVVSEGADWLTVSIADANSNGAGSQIKIDASATTEGNRSATVTVSSLGASKKVINVLQGDWSGIDSVVESGAETVSSEYYDLQGRKLYGEPANGLFIRKDIKADGSVKAVKIAK